MANKAILKGEFQYALLDKSKYAAQINDIISLSVKNVYQSEEVLTKSLQGIKL